MHFTLFTLTLAGCLVLSLGMERHSRQVGGQPAAPATRRRLRLAGGALLLAAPLLALRQHSLSLAISLSLGWLTVAALLVAALYAWKAHWLARPALLRRLGQPGRRR